MIVLRYEGLRELAQALRVVNHELFDALMVGLREVGEIVRKDARRRFVDYGIAQHPKRAVSFIDAADGFDTLVRPNTSTMAIVSVQQKHRRSSDMPRRRANFGDLMMRHALLPARNAGLPEAEEVLDREVVALLARHGF